MFSAEDFAHIIQFMSRVDLKGQEAPIYVALIQKLNMAGQAQAQKEKADAAAAEAPETPAPAPQKKTRARKNAS